MEAPGVGGLHKLGYDDTKVGPQFYDNDKDFAANLAAMERDFIFAAGEPRWDSRRLPSAPVYKTAPSYGRPSWAQDTQQQWQTDRRVCFDADLLVACATRGEEFVAEGEEREDQGEEEKEQSRLELKHLLDSYLSNEDKLALAFHLNEFEARAIGSRELLANLVRHLLEPHDGPRLEAELKCRLLELIQRLYIDGRCSRSRHAGLSAIHGDQYSSSYRLAGHRSKFELDLRLFQALIRHYRAVSRVMLDQGAELAFDGVNASGTAVVTAGQKLDTGASTGEEPSSVRNLGQNNGQSPEGELYGAALEATTEPHRMLGSIQSRPDSKLIHVANRPTCCAGPSGRIRAHLATSHRMAGLQAHELERSSSPRRLFYQNQTSRERLVAAAYQSTCEPSMVHHQHENEDRLPLSASASTSEPPNLELIQDCDSRVHELAAASQRLAAPGHTFNSQDSLLANYPIPSSDSWLQLSHPANSNIHLPVHLESSHAPPLPAPSPSPPPPPLQVTPTLNLDQNLARWRWRCECAQCWSSVPGPFVEASIGDLHGANGERRAHFPAPSHQLSTPLEPSTGPKALNSRPSTEYQVYRYESGPNCARLGGSCQAETTSMAGAISLPASPVVKSRHPSAPMALAWPSVVGRPCWPQAGTPEPDWAHSAPSADLLQASSGQLDQPTRHHHQPHLINRSEVKCARKQRQHQRQLASFQVAGQSMSSNAMGPGACVCSSYGNCKHHGPPTHDDKIGLRAEEGQGAERRDDLDPSLEFGVRPGSPIEETFETHRATVLVPSQAKGRLPLSVAEQMSEQANRFVQHHGKAAYTHTNNNQAAKSSSSTGAGVDLQVRRTLRVKICKSKPILGIAIEGGFNVSGQLLPRIVCVHEEGAAYQCGKLRVGDLILEVNGKSTVDMTHDQIAETIANAYYQDTRSHIEFLIGESMLI